MARGASSLHPKGSLAKGSWHAGGVTEGSHSWHFPKVQTNVDTCHPAESPRLGGAEAPPFSKGGFGLCFHYHRTNDTGRVREVTNR